MTAKNSKQNLPLLVTMLFSFSLLTACNGVNATEDGGKLQVLATTSIVGDVVKQVGGDHVQVRVLLPLGSDPHTFEPRPQDAAALAEAEIIFANGAGLEEFLQPLITSTQSENKVAEVSNGIDLLPLIESDEPSGGDPHTWMDPNNVVIWVENIRTSLAALDPVHSSDYQNNAEKYTTELIGLDGWIRSEVAQVPADRRTLVSDHAVFGYFANEYGFSQLGTITASFSSESTPTARELAALEDSIRAAGVRVLLVSAGSNQELANQLAADTGVKIVSVYHASLTDANGPAPTYLKFMRYNVGAIVEALK